MGDKEKIGIPRYGIEASEPHTYSDKERSGLPESYAKLILEIVSKGFQIEEGIFVDVGGGIGELAKKIEQESKIKSLAFDYSPVGMMENNVRGVVANATSFPLPNKVAVIVHAKDIVDHFDDDQLTTFIGETKRVLINRGKLVITTRNYDTGFPFFYKNSVSFQVEGVSQTETLLEGEKYPEVAARLMAIHGRDTVVDVPYFPRSKEEILNRFSESGIRCNQIIAWKAKENEPDWWNPKIPRNVMVFSL
jgi:SAM-dependent methyltransferase